MKEQKLGILSTLPAFLANKEFFPNAFVFLPSKKFPILFELRKSLKIILWVCLPILATYIVEVIPEITEIVVKISVLIVRILTTEMRG